MNWIIFAIIGHLGNGAAFLVDKILLTRAFKRSGTYAGLIGIMSFATVVAIPWVVRWPRGQTLVLAVLSGVTFVLALWLFFTALAKAEASRVVPIVGSLIPILTLAGTWTFLDEHLRGAQLVGFVVLVVATVILSSSGDVGRPSRQTISAAVFSALLFAVGSVTAKAVYDDVGFVSGLVVTRLAAAATGALIVLALDREAGREILRLAQNNNTHTSIRHAGAFALIGQASGATGFIFVQLATAQGSAALVNALQAVQYGFLVAVALILRRRAPQLLSERLDRTALMMKLLALVLTGVGLAMIS